MADGPRGSATALTIAESPEARSKSTRTIPGGTLVATHADGPRAASPQCVRREGRQPSFSGGKRVLERDDVRVQRGAPVPGGEDMSQGPRRSADGAEVRDPHLAFGCRDVPGPPSDADGADQPPGARIDARKRGAPGVDHPQGAGPGRDRPRLDVERDRVHDGALAGIDDRQPVRGDGRCVGVPSDQHEGRDGGADARDSRQQER